LLLCEETSGCAEAESADTNDVGSDSDIPELKCDRTLLSAESIQARRTSVSSLLKIDSLFFLLDMIALALSLVGM